MLSSLRTPGTFEHSLNELIDREIDLTVFASRAITNDATGAPTYDPAILLKIVLFAYSKSITSRREIERLRRENALFMALSVDTQPRFTTIADFISGERHRAPVPRLTPARCPRPNCSQNAQAS